MDSHASAKVAARVTGATYQASTFASRKAMRIGQWKR